MKTNTLFVGIEAPVAEVVLNNPSKLNPLSFEALQDLIDVAEFLNQQSGLRSVVIRGEGRAFCGGADLKVFRELEIDSDTADLGRRMADAVESITAVTVAAIHGYCVGGGVVLAAACDFRIAAADTTFLIPEVDLGIPLAWGGIPRLVREIGPAATRELVLTCRPFSAQEALALGFLTTVVEPQDLLSHASDLSQKLAKKSRLVVRQTLEAIRVATEDLISTSESKKDADLLRAAMRDEESSAVRQTYLQELNT